MSSMLAQAAPDPDLTRPILVIAVCAAIIIVTVLIQVVQARRRADDTPSGDVPDPQ